MERTELQQLCKVIRSRTGVPINCNAANDRLQAYIKREREEMISTISIFLSELDNDALNEYCTTNHEACNDDSVWKAVFENVFPSVYDVVENIGVEDTPPAEETMRAFLPWKTLAYEFLAVAQEEEILTLVEKVINSESFDVSIDAAETLVKYYDLINYFLAHHNLNWIKALIRFHSRHAETFVLKIISEETDLLDEFLREAAKGNNLPIVVLLSGAVSTVPLLEAVQYGNIDIVKYLVENSIEGWERGEDNVKDLIQTFGVVLEQHNMHLFEFLLNVPQLNAILSEENVKLQLIQMATSNIDAMRIVMRRYKSHDVIFEAIKEVMKNNQLEILQFLLNYVNKLSGFQIEYSLRFYARFAIEEKRNEAFYLILNSHNFSDDDWDTFLSTAISVDNVEVMQFLLEYVDNSDIIETAIIGLLDSRNVYQSFDFPTSTESLELALRDSRITKESLSRILINIDVANPRLIRTILSHPYADKNTLSAAIFSVLKRGAAKQFITELMGDNRLSNSVIISALKMLENDTAYPDESELISARKGKGEPKQSALLRWFVRNLKNKGFVEATRFFHSTNKLEKLFARKIRYHY